MIPGRMIIDGGRISPIRLTKQLYTGDSGPEIFRKSSFPGTVIDESWWARGRSPT